jgi:hypothetical protein
MGPLLKLSALTLARRPTLRKSANGSQMQESAHDRPERWMRLVGFAHARRGPMRRTGNEAGADRNRSTPASDFKQRR